MKLQTFLSCVTFVGALSMFGACSNDSVIEESTASTTTDNAPESVSLVVPAGSQYVNVVYRTQSGKKSIQTPITLSSDQSGIDASSMANATITICSPVATTVDVTDKDGNMLVENLFVPAVSNVAAAKTANVTLPETAVVSTNDYRDLYTFYHSSGVAMFDDSWPEKAVATGSSDDADFNDVILDYDIEGKVVNKIKETPMQGWRECVKVVMHVRAIGGTYPRTAGLELEGLDLNDVDSTEAVMTLGNDNKEIPSGSLKYKIETTTDRHPVITINNLNWLISSASHTATYMNSKTGKSQVVNSTVRKDYQYDGKYVNDLPQYYNVNRGYINDGGDLFTLTVVFHYKDRSKMKDPASPNQLKRMMNCVTKTTTQNFFIRTQQGYEIHMKGYNPTPFYTKYDTDIKGNKNAAVMGTSTYVTKDGHVWGFKVPVLQRHVWEKEAFAKAYKNFDEFLTSGGKKHIDWYNYVNNKGEEQCDDTKLVYKW